MNAARNKMNKEEAIVAIEEMRMVKLAITSAIIAIFIIAILIFFGQHTTLTGTMSFGTINFNGTIDVPTYMLMGR